MIFKRLIAIVAAAAVLWSCGGAGNRPQTIEGETITSPDGHLKLVFALAQDGTPMYSLDKDSLKVVLPSKLGFALFDNGGDLQTGFTVKEVTRDSFDEVWEPVWGEEAQIRNHYNELLVALGRQDGTAMNIRFRLYDDGLGFRYEFPIENKLIYFNIKEELTEFAMTGDHTAWWIPGDYSTQEFNPTESKLSQVRNLSDEPRPRGGGPGKQPR